MNPDPSLFLDPCEVIDFRAPAVTDLARRLAGDDQMQTAQQCFRFVRDEIKHSGDYQLNPVTWKASDVLAHGTGYCYAKSHLLCALLRASQIPAGLCYQRLSIDGTGAPYCLHGLGAMFLPEIGWYRVDPRGNRDGIDARFSPPGECLAFSTDLSGERDEPGLHVAPLQVVLDALRKHRTCDALEENLPDSPDARI